MKLVVDGWRKRDGYPDRQVSPFATCSIIVSTVGKSIEAAYRCPPFLALLSHHRLDEPLSTINWPCPLVCASFPSFFEDRLWLTGKGDVAFIWFWNRFRALLVGEHAISSLVGLSHNRNCFNQTQTTISCILTATPLINLLMRCKFQWRTSNPIENQLPEAQWSSLVDKGNRLLGGAVL
ncbi:unnamed protein product [Lactuca virosa]|uniref:Uncharacterized protein n=1 Tax=Lactuca virosa TaxID=75947 RepID=A0AAU9MKL2_9ASTR|nr:unnamed protein product [Lactuca virosa]